MTGFVTNHDAAPRRAGLGLVVLLAAFVVGGGVGAEANGGAKYDFRVFPSVGMPTTTFRVSFSAPFAAEDGYVLEGVGPRGCPSFFASRDGPSQLGDRVVIRLSPRNVLLKTRRRWCQGSYVGYVYSVAVEDRAETLIGYFRFGVAATP